MKRGRGILTMKEMTDKKPLSEQVKPTSILAPDRRKQPSVYVYHGDLNAEIRALETEKAKWKETAMMFDPEGNFTGSDYQELKAEIERLKEVVEWLDSGTLPSWAPDIKPITLQELMSRPVAPPETEEGK